MERQMCFLILSVLLLTVLNSALAQTKPSGVELGAALTLRPTFSGSITGIVWKLNGDLVAEWLNNEFEYYGTFRDRTTLDPTTGELVVKNVAVADAGLYTVEINSNVQSQKYQVEVMKKVPKPTVLFRPLTCSQTSASCILTCDGETKDAGTVTYSWKEDDREWKQGEKDKTIENNEEIKKVKIFSCQMKNAISVEESKPHDNLLFQEEEPHNPASTVGVVVGILCLVILIVALAVFAWIKGYIGRFIAQFRGGTNNPPPADNNLLSRTEANTANNGNQPLKTDRADE